MGESGHYAPGTENDPRAPWNQREPDPCPDCEGEGYVDSETGEACAADSANAVKCKACEGSGCAPEITQEDIDEVRGERDFDIAHDEGRI